MTPRSDLADCCPACFPDVSSAVLPSSVTEEENGSLRAEYGHERCGFGWSCWWDPAAANWPLRRSQEVA
jgi:hypothetical protein